MSALDSDPPLQPASSRPTLHRLMPPSLIRRRVLVVVGLAITGVCVWIVLRRVSVAEVGATLSEAHWVWLAPCLALTYLTLFVRAIRWRYLFADPMRVPIWESAKAINIGLLFSNILPSRAGEIPRILALGSRTGVSKVEVGGTVVVERVLDVLTIAFAGLVVSPWLPATTWVRALVTICAVIVVGICAAAMMVWVFRRRARHLSEAVLRRVPFISDMRASTITSSLIRGIGTLRDLRRLGLVLGFSALVWIAATLSVLVLFPAFDLPLSVQTAWLIVIATSLVMTVPSTSGGLGVYEAAVQASLVATGVSPSIALSFALVLHAVNFVPICLTGALATWSDLAIPRAAPRPGSDVAA